MTTSSMASESEPLTTKQIINPSNTDEIIGDYAVVGGGSHLLGKSRTCSSAWMGSGRSRVPVSGRRHPVEGPWSRSDRQYSLNISHFCCQNTGDSISTLFHEKRN